MNTHQPRLWPLLVLIVASIFIQPARVESGCAVTSTSNQMIGNAYTILKFLGGFTNCTRTMNMAMTCSPAGPLSTSGLLARATTGTIATMSVSCGWTCGCGGVTTDGSDGLPVELMDFAVEDDVAAVSGEESGEGASR